MVINLLPFSLVHPPAATATSTIIWSIRWISTKIVVQSEAEGSSKGPEEEVMSLSIFLLLLGDTSHEHKPNANDDGKWQDLGFLIAKKLWSNWGET